MQKHNTSSAESHYCSLWSDRNCWCFHCCSLTVVTQFLMPFYANVGFSATMSSDRFGFQLRCQQATETADRRAGEQKQVKYIISTLLQICAVLPGGWLVRVFYLLSKLYFYFSNYDALCDRLVWQ